MKVENLADGCDCLMEAIAAEYETKALSGDDSYDEEEIVKGVDFMYALTELKKPEIVICPSPMDMAIQSKLNEGETIDSIGICSDSGWTAFYDCMERIGVKYDDEFGFKSWKNFITKAGVFATVLCENVAFVCIRPCVVNRNKDGNLHNEKGLAIAWRDGYGEYFLNGVAVEEELVMTPAEKIDPKILLKEKNAEVRREIVRKIGIERICQKLDAKVVDKQGDYELLMLDIGDNRRRAYLKMKNPSIGIYHVEGVHPGCDTVDKALNFRNSGIGTKPIVLT